MEVQSGPVPDSLVPFRAWDKDVPSRHSGSPQDTAAQPDSLSCALGNSGIFTVSQTPQEDSDQGGQPGWDLGPSAVPVEACSI